MARAPHVPAKTRRRKVPRPVPICGYCQKPIPEHDLVHVMESVFHNACTRPPLSELEYAEVLRKVIQEEVRNAVALFVRMTRAEQHAAKGGE